MAILISDGSKVADMSWWKVFEIFSLKFIWKDFYVTKKGKKVSLQRYELKTETPKCSSNHITDLITSNRGKTPIIFWLPCGWSNRGKRGKSSLEKTHDPGFRQFFINSPLEIYCYGLSSCSVKETTLYLSFMGIFGRKQKLI